MPQGKYLPEGMLINTDTNKNYISGTAGLTRAAQEGAILEATAVMCDAAHNLIVDVGGIRGVIPRKEAALGIESGRVKDIAIISRVGKPVCFKVIGDRSGEYLLSRRAAQQEAHGYFMEELERGEVIKSIVTHIEPFGAFVDIGCGIVSLIGIENISVARISHPGQRFVTGQAINAVVTGKDRESGRINLSHRELLGTWQQNAAVFSTGQTAVGIVRGVEDYGVFVELRPNLSGLAERFEGVGPGDAVSVFIKSIRPDRMKIKLIIIDDLMRKGDRHIRKEDYYITSGRLDSWVYSPPGCHNRITSAFLG